MGWLILLAGSLAILFAAFVLQGIADRRKARAYRDDLEVFIAERSAADPAFADLLRDAEERDDVRGS